MNQIMFLINITNLLLNIQVHSRTNIYLFLLFNSYYGFIHYSRNSKQSKERTQNFALLELTSQFCFLPPPKKFILNCKKPLLQRNPMITSMSKVNSEIALWFGITKRFLEGQGVLPPYNLTHQFLFPNHLQIKRIKEGGRGRGGGGCSPNASKRKLFSLLSLHSSKTVLLSSS